MKQYNIYAGLGGSFGGAVYQHTILCETEGEAVDEAYELACEAYESYAGYHGLPDWEEATEAYCESIGISPEDLEGDIEAPEIIEEYYNEARESWLDYYAIPTEEDNINQEDLILDYVIDNDSPSQTGSE